MNIKRAFWVILAITLIVWLSVGAYYLFIFRPKTLQSRTPSIIPTIIPTKTTLSSKEIIKETLQFIEGQRLDYGFYNYTAYVSPRTYEEEKKIAEGKAKEEELLLSPRSNFLPMTNSWTTLAYLAAHKVFQDQSYFEQAREDSQNLLAFCREEDLGCQFDLQGLIELYNIAPSEDILEFLQDSGEELLTNPPSDSLTLNIAARELAQLYQLTDDARFVNEAKNQLELAEEKSKDYRLLYTLSNSSLSGEQVEVHGDVCWNTLAGLEIHKVSGEEKYLAEVENKLQQIDLQGNYSQFDTPRALEPCVETLQELYQITGKENYQRLARETLIYLLKNHWDSFHNKKFFGEGMVLVLKNSKLNVLPDSAYIIVLLSNDLSLNLSVTK